MKTNTIPNVSVEFKREQVDVTLAGILGSPASTARETIPGLTTVYLTIGDETFILTPEEYAESVAEWAEALNLAGKRRVR